MFACILCIKPASGKNLFTEGSSFETGMKGFQVRHEYLLGDRDDYVPPYEMDSGTAVHGKHSLKLNAVMRGRYGLNSRVYTLEPGREYTLSLYAKADKPVSLNFQLTSTMGAHSVGVNGNARLTDQWQRYSVTGILTEGEKYLTYKKRYFFSIFYYDSPSATIWIDGIQLEEGEPKEYVPGETSEINLEHPRTGNMFYLGEKPEPASIKIFMEQPESRHHVMLTTRNLYTGEVIGTRTLNVPKGKTHYDIPYNLPVLPRGIYGIDADLSLNGETVSQKRFIFCFISRHDPAKEVAAERSYLGVHGDFPLWITRWNPDADFSYGHAAPGWFHEVLRDLGIHWQRIDTLGPQVISRQEKGQIYGGHIESTARYYRSFGVNLMPTLGAGHYSRGPSWLTSEKRSTRTGHPLFDLDGYRMYLEKLVKAAPSINHWETFNEPASNSGFSAEEFLELQKVSYETIKSIRPDDTVIGLCPTGDLGGNLSLWTRKMIELGALDYTDVISAHGYYAHYGRPGSRSAYSELKRLVPEKHRDMPWWDTETLLPSKSSYDMLTMEMAPLAYGFSDWQYTPVQQAVRGLGIFAETFALGVQRQFIHAWLPVSIFYGPTGALFEYDLSPRPIIPAIDAFNELVDGGEPKGVVDLGGDNKCYFFEKDGSLVVFFQADKPQRVEIPVSYRSVTVLDLMGNPVKTSHTRSGSLLIDAGIQPFYILGNKNISVEEMKTAFRKTQMQTVLFSCTGPRLGYVDGKPALIVRVLNEAVNAGLSGMVAVDKLAPGFASDTKEIVFQDLAIREAQDFVFPLKKFRPSEINPCSFTVSARGQEQTAADDIYVLKSVRAKAAPAVDGTGKNWPETLSAAVIDRADQIVWKVQGIPWTGLQDCSAKLYSMWDDKHIYFRAVVTDEKVMISPEIKSRVEENPLYIYLADCVEFFFDADLMGDFWMRTWNSDDYQVLASPGVSDGIPVTVATSGAYGGDTGIIKASSSLTSAGYIVEVRIPFEIFKEFKPGKGMMMGFDFAVDDDDAEGLKYEAETEKPHKGRDIQMKWSSPEHSPATWGVLVFE